MNLSYSFFFVVVLDFLEFGELLFFPGMLNTRFLGGVREGGASGCHMSTFVAMEAKSLLGALFLFLRSELLQEFDCINVHGIGVLGDSGGRGE